MEEGRELWRLEFSRTKRATRLRMQETPAQELHGSEVEFQEVRMEFWGSAVDLKRRRGAASGWSHAAAWWRKRRRMKTAVVGFGFSDGGGAAIVGNGLVE